MYYILNVDPKWSDIKFHSTWEQASEEARTQAKNDALRGNDGRITMILSLEESFKAEVPTSIVDIKSIDNLSVDKVFSKTGISMAQICEAISEGEGMWTRTGS